MSLWDDITRRDESGQAAKGGPNRRRSKRKDLEAGVLRECIKWLRAQPDVLYVERRNTGAVQFEGGGFMRFGFPGAADLWCVVAEGEGLLMDGATIPAHVEIECKRADGKGRLSPTQKAFQRLCHEKGIPYLVVTSAEDLAKKFRGLGY